MAWKALARSAAGTSHLRQGQPCQDHSGLLRVGDALVGAVADGAGSAPLAEVGARLAVRRVVAGLGRWARRRAGGGPPEVDEARAACLEALDAVRDHLAARATAREARLPDLACTLIAWVATPGWLAAMQVGDGFLVARACGGEEYRLIFRPDRGEYANETSFVTSAGAAEALQVAVLDEPAAFVCGATDGLERVAIRLSDWTPFAPFFRPLEEYLRETPSPGLEDGYLRDFLASERLNARTDDDKTLALALYEPRHDPHTATPA